MKNKFRKGIRFEFFIIFISSIMGAAFLIILNQLFLRLIGISDIELAKMEEKNAFIYFLVFLLLTTLLYTFSSRIIIKRIEIIIDYVKKLKNGNFDIILQVNAKDEIGELAENINNMVKAIKESREKQKRLEASKNEIISNISHDLRTPLTSLSGYIELVKHNLHDPSVCGEYIEIIDTKCNNLKNQVNDLLEYCNLNYKEFKVEKQCICVKELMEQVIIDFIPQMEKEGITYILEIPQEKLSIYADINLFVRLLHNLISNAIFYGKSGRRIKVEALSKEETVMIKVINYGETIAKEDIPYVFERFYRGEKSRNENTGGKGMGLAVVKSIVELHAGTITVHSDDTQTDFEITLPNFMNPNLN